MNTSTVMPEPARIVERQRRAVKAKAWSADQAFAMGVSIRTGFKWWRRFREEGPDRSATIGPRAHTSPERNIAERARAGS